jgi:hypothetical protein
MLIIKKNFLLTFIVLLFASPSYSSSFNTCDDDSNSDGLPRQCVSVKGYPEAMPGESVDVTIEYNTNDDNPFLYGLGFRIHYDSSVLQFNGLVDYFEQNSFFTPEPIYDADDYDVNTVTDRYIEVSWGTLLGNWPGVNLPADLLTLNFDVTEGAIDSTSITFSSFSTSSGYSFDPTDFEMPITNGSLDFDKNGKVDALTDGMLLLRYSFGLRGSMLTNGLIAHDSPLTPSDVEEITGTGYSASYTDFDGSEQTDALTDVLMLLRYLFDVREDDLVAGAIALGAIRDTSSEIEQYIANFIPSDNSESNDNSEPVTDPPFLAYPETALNFSASSTASGYIFDGNNCVVSAVAYESIGCEQASPSVGTQSIYVKNIHKSDTQMVVALGYESNNNNTTPGIGFRLHYDSDALTVDSVTINSSVFLPVVLGYQSDDFEDADNDPSTDQKLSFGLVDMMGSFQSPLSDLATITFDINPGPWPIDENIGAGKIVYKVSTEDFVGIGSDITFGLNGNDTSSFTINEQTGEVTLIDNPDYEAQQQYNFSVIATDMAGNSSEKPITLVVKNLDDTAPVITSAAFAESINENSGSGQIIYTVTADDSADISDGFFYGLVADDQPFSINKQTGEVTLLDNPDHEAQHQYNFSVTATDLAGNSSQNAVTFTVNNLDEVAPVFTSSETADPINENIGADVVIYTATADDSYDISDGLFFSLAEGSDSALSIDETTGEVTLTNNPDYEQQSVYTFSLIATDTVGFTDELMVSLNVNNLDDVAPYIDVNLYIESIEENSGAGQVISQCTADDSADISGGVTFSLAEYSYQGLSINSNSCEVTLLNNPDYENLTVLDYAVIATDAAGNANSHFATLNIINLDDTAPIFTSDNNAESIDENSGAGQIVYTATADDSNDTSGGVTFSLTEDSDSALSIDASSGNVILDNDPDHETQSQYSFAIIATDMAGNTSDTKYVTLDINNLDDTAPTIISSTTATAIDENSGSGQIIYTATADDSNDISGGVTFSLMEDSDSALSIDASSGNVILNNDPDHETQSQYSFAIIASDMAGNTSDTKYVTLDINNLDDTAPIVALSVVASVIDENSGAGQVVCTATADDSNDTSGGVTLSLTEDSDSALSIEASSGDVILNNDPDHETQSQYSFAIIATDMAGNTSDAEYLTLNINNLDELGPIITSSDVASAIDENSGAGQVVYIAVADDTADVSDGVTFSLAESSDLAFTINATTGDVILDNDPDHETQSQYSFEVVATDMAGNTSNTKPVTLDINNLDDTAPIVTSSTTATAIDENSGAGQVVYTVTADDSADISQGMNFSLSGNDAEAFSINGETGEISILVDPDYESQSEYNFTVNAIDNAGNSSSKDIILQINDLDEDPVADSETQIISVTNSPKGILGRTSILEVSYDTSDSNNQLSGLGMRVHFNSSLLSFKQITNLIEQDIIIDGQGPYSDESDLDNDPLTDQYMMFGWASLLNNWPDVELPTVLMNISFDVSNTVDINAVSSTSINFTDSAFTAGYGFNAESYELGLLKATWDLDGNGEADALTDGLLILRYLFGLRGEAVTNTAIAMNSPLSPTEVITEVEASLDIVDIDADGRLNALTDGLMLLRYLFGFEGQMITNQAVGPNANRSSHEEIVHYIESFLPAMQ